MPAALDMDGVLGGVGIRVSIIFPLVRFRMALGDKMGWFKRVTKTRCMQPRNEFWLVEDCWTEADRVVACRVP